MPCHHHRADRGAGGGRKYDPVGLPEVGFLKVGLSTKKVEPAPFAIRHRDVGLHSPGLLPGYRACLTVEGNGYARLRNESSGQGLEY